MGNVYSQTVTKKINGQSYVFEKDRTGIWRAGRPSKANYLELGKEFEIKNNEIAYSVLKRVLGVSRIKTLLDSNQNRIGLNFVCDSNGKVKYVRFFSDKGIGLTDEEIYKLEKEFLKQKFPVTILSNAGKARDVTFSHIIRLQKILEME